MSKKQGAKTVLLCDHNAGALHTNRTLLEMDGYRVVALLTEPNTSSPVGGQVNSIDGRFRSTQQLADAIENPRQFFDDELLPESVDIVVSPIQLSPRTPDFNPSNKNSYPNSISLVSELAQRGNDVPIILETSAPVHEQDKESVKELIAENVDGPKANSVSIIPSGSYATKNLTPEIERLLGGNVEYEIAGASTGARAATEESTILR